MKNILSALILTLAAAGCSASGDTVSPQPVNCLSSNCRLVGVDQFGRSFGTVSGWKEDRKVGMFYWPWIGQPYASGAYDATSIRALPDGLGILTDPKKYDPSVSPSGQAHFWGEPLWGYYNSEDEWVIRKQMQMLTMAGVDFIFFDHTNAIIYPEVLLKVCSVIQDLIDEGWNPPRVCSYTHSHSFATVRQLYSTLYGKNLYPDTWCRVDGKPVVIAYTDPEDDLAEAAKRSDKAYQPGTLSQEILDFFYFYKPDWPFDPTYPDGFTWIEWSFPQPLHTESQMMNVTVASHPMVPMSFSLTRENWINWGRGWDPERQENIEEGVDKGTFFQAQWDHAIEVDPPTVAVGGWNEWIAYKQIWDGEYMLCDAATKEYSRDIEPMAGGYQDAFYLQLIDNIRRYKGLGTSVEGEPRHAIRTGGPVSQWDDVSYVVRNVDSRQIARDAYGVTKSIRYTHPAPDNRLIEVRVAHDARNIFFYLKAKDAFTEPDQTGKWLNIFIGCGTPSAKGWEGYEYLVGSSVSDGSVSVETVGPDRTLKSAGSGSISLSGDVIQVSVPRKALGLDRRSLEGLENGFYFKVAMGVDDPSDIMDYYKSGSVMPMGRLSYQYIFGK